MIRLGVTSRSAAIWSRVVQSARTAPRARRPRTLCRPDVRRHWSIRVVWAKPAQRLELLGGPPVLAGLDQLGGEQVAQLDQHLDVEGGVLEPRARAAAGSTSRRRSAPWPSGSPAASRRAWPARRGGGRAGDRRARCRRVGSGRDRARSCTAGPGWRRAGSTRCPRGPPATAPASRRRWGRPGPCWRPRGAAGSGRRGPSSGSPRRARRRSRPARLPAARASQNSASARLVSTILGSPSRRVRSGASGRSVASGSGVLAEASSGAGRRGEGQWRPALAQRPGPRCPRRLGIAVTPSGTGSSPTAVHSSSPRPRRAARRPGRRR